MRILILTQYFYPEPEAIPLELATGLAKRGHEVIVATGFPNYPYGRIFSGYKQRLWKTEVIQGVKVCRFPLYPDQSRSIFGRCLYYLSLTASITLLGIFFFNNIDIIFVYHFGVSGVLDWSIAASAIYHKYSGYVSGIPICN